MQRYLDAPAARAAPAGSPGDGTGNGSGDDHLPWVVASGAGLVVVLGLTLVVVARGRRSRA